MKIKRLVILAVVFSVLLNLALVSVVGACEEPPPPPPELGIIIVHKFNDANGNGEQDAGETDIVGWPIRLYMWDGPNLVLHTESETGQDGTVTLGNLPSNWYKVWEEARSCWMPTAPEDIGYHDGGYYVARVLNEYHTAYLVDFGNTYTCAPLEGCTPGGWQGGNLSWRWDQVGDPDWNPPGGNPFDHATVFNTFFDPVDSLAGLTVFDLVDTGGKKDHARKAARSLVAAYLNASHTDVSYPATEGELMGMWAAAVTSGEFLDLHKTLDEWNNLGCSVE